MSNFFSDLDLSAKELELEKLVIQIEQLADAGYKISDASVEDFFKQIEAMATKFKEDDDEINLLNTLEQLCQKILSEKVKIPTAAY